MMAGVITLTIREHGGGRGKDGVSSREADAEPKLILAEQGKDPRSDVFHAQIRFCL